jgi:hypothetical protein
MLTAISIILQILSEENLNINDPVVRGAVQRTFLPQVRRAVEDHRLGWNAQRKPKDPLTPGAAFLQFLPEHWRLSDEDRRLSMEG